MAEKKLNTRILLRYDDYANWYSKNPKLLKGEVAIATIPENHVDPSTGEVTQIPAVVMKVGTGAETGSNYRDLPFTSAKAADVYAWAKEGALVSNIIGEGNAFTNVEWDATLNGGKGGLKFTKGTKFATSAELEAAVEKFTGDVGSITDTNTITNVELVTAEGEHQGQIKVSIQKTVDGANDGEPVVTYLDVVTPDELENELSNYVEKSIIGYNPPEGVNITLTEYINLNDGATLQNAKAYVDSEDVFHTDITTVNALGGIAAGADLDGMTTHEILNTLLFPYVAFVLGSTSRSAAAATLENGATQTLSSASISITKKSKPITSVKLLNGSTVLGEKTGDDVAAGGTITFSNLGITVSKSNNPNLKFTVTDGTTSTDKSVGASTFVYPYYMGECAANATIDETLVEGLTKKVESKGNKTVTHSVENGRMVIAYPKAHGVLKSILDPNNFETIGDYTRSEVSVTGLDGTTQTYYVYASGAATVSGFKVQYKY